jgi:hypothetical protein
MVVSGLLGSVICHLLNPPSLLSQPTLLPTMPRVLDIRASAGPLLADLDVLKLQEKSALSSMTEVMPWG